MYMPRSGMSCNGVAAKKIIYIYIYIYIHMRDATGNHCCHAMSCTMSRSGSKFGWTFWGKLWLRFHCPSTKL